MKQVQVRINEKGFFANQRYAFSDRYTLVSELMQNARRAGAGRVSIEYDANAKLLRVADDGCGIADFQQLLTLHESGWNEALCAEERPFGVGFSKCLYSAARCSVSSRGQRIEFDTGQALAQAMIEVQGCEFHPGTIVTLHEVELPELAAQIARRCRGFPIPVSFNGHEIDRPYGIGRLPFEDTEIGKVHLAGLEDGKATHDTLVFLQGFCVIDERGYSRDRVNVVHLDPRRFIARLPDRDRLIDEADQKRKIDAALTAEWRKVLERRKRELSPQAFCATFFSAARSWGQVDLFDDVPLLPKFVCHRIVGYPYQEGYGDADYLAPVTEWISQQDVEQGRYPLCELDDVSVGNVPLWMFARAGALVVVQSGALGDRHWVNEAVRRLDEEEAVIEIIGERQRSEFDGRWIWPTVVLCDAYAIIVGNDRVVISDQALYDESTDSVIVPQGETSGQVCRQVSDYIDDNDQYREDEQEADVAAMHELIHRLRSPDPQATLESLIEALRLERYPLLHGKTFQLKVGFGRRDCTVEIVG